MTRIGLVGALIDIRAEDAVIIHVIKARVAGTCEAPERISAGRLIRAVVGAERTLIDVITDRTISRISSVTVTFKEAWRVRTGRVLVTGVISSLTLIDVNTVDSIPSISGVAYTLKEGIARLKRDAIITDRVGATVIGS